METLEAIRTSLQQGEWVTSIDFKVAYFHIPKQEIYEISCPGQVISLQSTAIQTVHSSSGVHCDSKGGETDGHAQGYKNPPVPRRLVSESQILINLSPADSRTSKKVSQPRLATEFGNIRAVSQTSP